MAARKRGNSQHAGKFWLGSYERIGDKGTGTLTSTSFVVTHPWASFLIGAGRSMKTEIVSEADGKVILSASGEDREDMKRVAVNLESVAEKRIFIRITDQSQSG